MRATWVSSELAATTPGLSGADLKNLVNEGALLAARRGRSEVHQKDFVDALEKIVLGPERPLLLSTRIANALHIMKAVTRFSDWSCPAQIPCTV